MELHRSARTSPAYPAPTPWANRHHCVLEAVPDPAARPGPRQRAPGSIGASHGSRYSSRLLPSPVGRASPRVCPDALTSQMTDSTLLRKLTDYLAPHAVHERPRRTAAEGSDR